MNISLLVVTAVLAVAPLRASASDICAPYAAFLKIGWSLNYERVDGPARAATLDKSECSSELVTYSPRDMGGYDSTEYPEPRLRFWSQTSPYEVSVELSGGWAHVVLIKREGPYRRVMARIDRLAENELTTTTLDYTGDVADGEYPELRSGRGVRKIVRAGRVFLRPFSR